MAVETGGEDAGVVKNEQVGGIEVVGQVSHLVVAEFDGIGIHGAGDEHPCRATLGQRVAGDTFIGQVVVEIGFVVGHDDHK